MTRTIINLDGSHIETAYHLTNCESMFNNRPTQCSQDSRAVGILGEIAAAEFLRGMYGIHRTVVPMGIFARSGGGMAAFEMGDIITIKSRGKSQHMREVQHFEVKARTAGTGKGNLIRCDSAEKYAAKGVSRVIFVDVDITADGAACQIVGYHKLPDVLQWEVVTNGMGQECYRMPDI